MLEGSFWELSLIFLIALVVFGPERLPGLARSVGLWVGRARATLRNLNEQIERELAAEEMRKAASAARESLNEVVKPSSDPGGKSGDGK
ncbi:MAG TPA: Sec-independent protein translocase protein TatB [Gammaproteobacteria bacterium]|jgi:sec-independent protein translocase protein TatB|nr:Sec-independent protein translocase protein TatB [Gammaproteobacteria bacterium]